MMLTEGGNNICSIIDDMSSKKRDHCGTLNTTLETFDPNDIRVRLNLFCVESCG